MKEIALRTLPNQSVSFTADGSYWELHFFLTMNHVAVDISRDGVQLITGHRVVGGILVVPYEYLWNPGFGNLVFDAEPDWEQFGTNCKLNYLSNAEAIDWLALTES